MTASQKSSKFRPSLLQRHTIRGALFALASFLILPCAAGPGKVPVSNPDLTKGEPLPPGKLHDWNLGATGAWMKEFGAWYYDLARTWDGRFPHQGPPELDFDSYGGWDATGGYLLAYAMPLRKSPLT